MPTRPRLQSVPAPGSRGRPVEGVSRAVVDAAVAEERKRIALDLHDHLGQQIVGAKLMLASLERNSGSPELAPQIAALRASLEQLSLEIKAISSGMRLGIPSPDRLVEALEELANRWMSHTQIQVDVSCDILKKVRFCKKISEVVYRVVQESLTNIAKHAANATLVEIRAELQYGFLKLTIEDDGPGFSSSPESFFECQQGRYGNGGISGIRERVGKLGGDVTIRRPADKKRGSAISVSIPIGHPNNRSNTG
ncbi:sensor histidine kinase [Stappia sediminis]|uniref:sensor histidine kinase n=1 Tax=Stappia sediminis TaxID=2692190 RepID=UPI0013703E5B|nr:ATP-binding protein [Stappia sediminis]